MSYHEIGQVVTSVLDCLNTSVIIFHDGRYCFGNAQLKLVIYILYGAHKSGISVNYLCIDCITPISTKPVHNIYNLEIMPFKTG